MLRGLTLRAMGKRTGQVVRVKKTNICCYGNSDYYNYYYYVVLFVLYYIITMIFLLIGTSSLCPK